MPGLKNVYKKLNNQFERDEFVISELQKLPKNLSLLDAGCGSQRYRPNCSHLNYKTQDFGQYKVDQKETLGTDSAGGTTGYQYGALDYVGNIWQIEEKSDTFDAILCTEVFEHIPYPIETVKEFSRLLKKDGKLILTAPSNCLRHMDPYFFYNGFTDRWYEKFLKENGLEAESITPVGDYSCMAVEVARTAMSHSFFAKLLVVPAFIYFYNKKRTQASINTWCMGYHIVARKV